MSHRRPEHYPPRLESVLRNALRLAADSVDPAADGLDRIRAKIATHRSAPLARWRMALIAYFAPLWQQLGPAGAWCRRAASAVHVRFKREPGRTDLLGWLRPAAALATGLFVVASASWAIAVLPSATTSGNYGHFHTGGSVGTGLSTSASPTGGGSTFVNGTSGSPAVSSSPSVTGCSSASPQPSNSSSFSPPGSPSPSPSTSSSSSSGSPSPSPSATGSQSSSSSSAPSPSAAASTPTSQAQGTAGNEGIPQTQASQASPLAQLLRSIEVNEPSVAGPSSSPVQNSPPPHPTTGPCS